MRGGANKYQLTKCGLDEDSHLNDWLKSILPLTPAGNLKNSARENVKGNKTSKFAVSNWATYFNTKILLVIAG